MFITGIGTAVPARQFSQAECWGAAQGHPGFERLAPGSKALVRKVLLGQNGITTRHLAVDSIEEVFDISPDRLHGRFARHAPALAEEAGRRALLAAGIALRGQECPRYGARVEEVDGLIISTCTGYLCPGLTSYVAGALGLRGDITALDLVGQGCGAALPNMGTAQALLAANRARRVLSICVEICSAAFYLDDDPGVLISNCLFGDGAGALVLSNEAPTRLTRKKDEDEDERRLGQPASRIVEWKSSRSMLHPAERDLLRFEQKGGMLRNILTREVPALAAAKAEQLLKQVLHASSVHKKEIAAWIVHAGGKDVLAAIGHRLALPEDALCWSAQVLNELGNVSSPFVIHVLERALAGGAPDGYWWMTSFGAGFSCHGALLEVR